MAEEVTLDEILLAQKRLAVQTRYRNILVFLAIVVVISAIMLGSEHASAKHWIASIVVLGMAGTVLHMFLANRKRAK